MYCNFSDPWWCEPFVFIFGEPLFVWMILVCIAGAIGCIPVNKEK